MKKTIVAVVLILAVVASIPFASGLLMERTVRSAFEDLNAIYAETGVGYSLEIIEYNRGYSTSDIEWKIDLGMLKAVYPIDEIVFTDHAKHGFTGVVATTSLEKNAWFTKFVDEFLEGRNPVQITTKYGLLGDIESTMSLEPVSISVGAEKIDVKPAKMVMTTDYKLKQFTSSGTWEGMSAGEELLVGKMTMDSTLQMFSAFLWNGDIRFAVDNMKAKDKDKDKQFEISGLEGKYILEVNDDQTSLGGEVVVSIDNIVAKDTVIKDASARFAAKGVDAKGYEEFMKMYTQTMTKVMGDMAKIDKNSEQGKAMMNQQMAAVGFQMVAAYEKLLKEGLELQISPVQVKLAEGDIKGDITLRLLQDMSFMQFAPLAAQPHLLLDIFYLKSDITIPVKLIGENPKLLSPVFPGMQTGLFVIEGDNLVHKAETTGGKLMVNGQEVVLAP